MIGVQKLDRFDGRRCLVSSGARGGQYMRVLRRQPPTAEQIGIVRRIQKGVSLIRGAAGSGSIIVP